MSIREKERFRETFCLASQTAKELNLEYYTSDPKRLTLQEALYLIAPKKKLSDVAIPLTSNTFPWKVPNGGEEIKSMSKEIGQVQKGPLVKNSYFLSYPHET